MAQSQVEFTRKKFENPTEWKLRKRFLQKNLNLYEPSRLECLSHCFINMEMYGASYPAEVMNQVRQCSDGLVDEMMKRRKIAVPEPVQFVKQVLKIAEKDDCTIKSEIRPLLVTNGRVQNNTYQTQKVEPSSAPVSNKTVSNKRIPKKKAKNKGKSPSLEARFQEAEQSSLLEERTAALQELVDTTNRLCAGGGHETSSGHCLVSLLYMAASKIQCSLSTPFDFAPAAPTGAASFVCRVLLNGDTLLAIGSSSSKKKAKAAAFDTLMTRFTTWKQLEVVDDLETGKMKAQRAWATLPVNTVKMEVATSSTLSDTKGDLSDDNWVPPNFVKQIYIREMLTEQGKANASVSVLTQTADFFQLPIEITYKETPSVTTAYLSLKGVCIGEAQASGKVEARLAVSNRVHNRLRKHLWTMVVKQSADFMLSQAQTGISKNATSGMAAKAPKPLQVDNVGSRMMRKMGWTGEGGLGKKGDGRAEPVPSDITVIHRRGLGSCESHREIVASIRLMLADYAASGKEEDICLSTEFSNDERRTVHTECRKLDLVSRSWNTSDGNRCLVISRKRSPDQLFDWIRRAGGETTRYQLIPPGTQTSFNPPSTAQESDDEERAVAFSV